MKFLKELKKLENKKNSLKKQKTSLIITDFDDTIFSTEELIKKDIRKGRRGQEGNIYIKEVIGIDKVINDFYKNKDFPKEIVSKLRTNHDLILTAGMQEFASKKIKSLGLDKFNYIVVENANEKILETIKYVINSLGFIPSNIIIYEDRPKFFIEFQKIIENFLGTQVDIMQVEMDGNKGYKKIEKITGL